MSHSSLADFLETLAAAGELKRVSHEVDPKLEIAEITDRTVKSGGPALLFGQVRGHDTVVVTNLFGSVSRICRALGADSLEAFAERAARLTAAGGRQNWLDRLKLRSGQADVERFRPKTVKVGACQQVVKLGRDVDLHELPALRSWPEETVASITAGQVLSAHGETGRANMGRHVLTVLDRNRLALVADPYGGVSSDFEAKRRSGEKWPLAVVLGGDPRSMVLGSLPLPGEVDPLTLSGLLAEESLEVVACRTQPLEVPAGAEIIIEGYVEPDEPPVASGRFAAPTGFYHESAACPVVHVTALTHRANAAFPATVFGLPVGEMTAVDRLVERLLVPVVESMVPELVDLALPAFGGRNNFLFVSIRKTYVGQARKVASALWGLAPLMQTKSIVVLDEHVDVHDVAQVMFRVGANLRPERDIFFQDGPADPFDHAVTGSFGVKKMGIDATAKLPGEHARPWPAELAGHQPTRDEIERRWAELAIE